MKERRLGLLGRKVGMTRVFTDTGDSLGVTVLELGPCVVLAKRTATPAGDGRADGYTALQLGFGPKRAKRSRGRPLKKAESGHLRRAGGDDKARRFVLEVRVPEEVLARFEVGQEVTLKDFGVGAGDRVDVAGRSKGKGYQGVMRRYGFAGFRASHGTHEYFRHGGSIGCRKFPGRVFKGRKMPGHMGDRRVTTQNVRVVQVREEDNVLLVHGSVPGSANGYVVVRPAIKQRTQPPQS
jgi:large subunit ribosomal protein L3